MAAKFPPALINILKSPRSPHKIHLIGTVHKTRRSNDDVRDLIAKLKPHVVFFELCNRRRHFFDYGRSFYDDKNRSMREKLGMFFKVTCDRMFTVDSEFRVAYEAAGLCKASIVLGDRDMLVTQRRSVRKLIASKMNVEDLLDKEHARLDMIIGIGEKNPWGVEPFIFERDLYMMNELVLTIERIEGDEPKDVVAVVGAGHVPGIVERWNNEMKHPGSELDKSRLMEINRIPVLITSRASDDNFISENDFRQCFPLIVSRGERKRNINADGDWHPLFRGRGGEHPLIAGSGGRNLLTVSWSEEGDGGQYSPIFLKGSDSHTANLSPRAIEQVEVPPQGPRNRFLSWKWQTQLGSPPSCRDADPTLVAEVLLIELLLPDKISSQYRLICKKHAKVYLLNRVVQIHDVIRLNEFLGMRVEWVRHGKKGKEGKEGHEGNGGKEIKMKETVVKNKREEVEMKDVMREMTNEVISNNAMIDQYYLISTSTRIMFRNGSSNNFSSVNPAIRGGAEGRECGTNFRNNVDKRCTGESASLGDKMIKYKTIQNNASSNEKINDDQINNKTVYRINQNNEKRRILLEMKIRIIAEDKFLISVRNQLVQGLSKLSLGRSNYCINYPTNNPISIPVNYPTNELARDQNNNKNNKNTTPSGNTPSYNMTTTHSYNTPASNMTTGMVIRADPGAGKTHLLEALYGIFGTDRCVMMSAKTLSGKNRGDIESTILGLFNDCVSSCSSSTSSSSHSSSSSGRRLILIDDIDILAPAPSSDSTPNDSYVTNAILHGIDTIIQKYNRNNTNENNSNYNGNNDRNKNKIFIIATCADENKISKSLLVPHRLGDIKKVLLLPFPSQKKRFTLIHNLLTCDGVNIIWDLTRQEGGMNLGEGSPPVRSINDNGENKESKDSKDSKESTLIDDSDNIDGKAITTVTDDEQNALQLALTLSHRTQGASVSDLVSALQTCLQDSVIDRLYPSIVDKISMTDHSLTAIATHEKEVFVLASSIVRSMKEILPSVAMKHDITSLLVDNAGEGEGEGGDHVMLCIEGIQRRLIDAVLLPYISRNSSGFHRDARSSSSSSNNSSSSSSSSYSSSSSNGKETDNRHNGDTDNVHAPHTPNSAISRSISTRQKGLSLSHCSGVLIHGPSSCGKTSLARWLAHEGRGHFKFLSVACADLVHKVVGESEKKLSMVFAAAREMSPCFLLLDNLEIILGSGSLDGDKGEGGGGGGGVRGGSGGTRTRTAHQALDRLLSTLLVEIDGLSSSRTLSKYKNMSVNGRTMNGRTMNGRSIKRNEINNEEDVCELGEGEEEGEEEGEGDMDFKPVIVIATTSNIKLIDRSLIRPGRLEEHIAMDMPNEQERVVMAKYFLEKMLDRGRRFTGGTGGHGPGGPGGGLSEEQQELIERARQTLSLDSVKEDIIHLRSPGDIKNHLQERAMAIIRTHTESVLGTKAEM